MFTEEEFKRLIPDEGIRNYILESIGRKPFNGSFNYFRIYQNILNLAFMYALSCYTDMRNRNLTAEGKPGILDQCKKDGNANSLRVIRTLENIYSSYPITTELIQFVLLDIQFDFIQGEHSKLKRYFPDCFYGNAPHLNAFFEMVNLSLVSSRLDEYEWSSFDALEQNLRKLVSLFPFLTSTSLEYCEKAGWYVFKLKNDRDCKKIYPDGVIHTYGLIHRISNGRRSQFYYLSAIDKNVLRYENLSASQNCILTGSETSDPAAPKTGEVIEEPYELSWDEEAVHTYLKPDFFWEGRKSVKKLKIDQLFNINYKHIKNLALAISDALGRVDRRYGQELIEEFSASYPEICASYQKENPNWDPIIAMLLIEATPSRVLQVVFKDNPDVAYDTLKNLKNRFGEEFSAKLSEIETREDFTSQAEQLIEINQLRLGNKPVETATFKKIREELLAEAKAAIILSALSDVAQEKTIYSSSIGQGVESLKSLKGKSNEEVCLAIRGTLGVVLERITCFYAGIFAYGEKKLEYDKKSESKLLPLEEIKMYQNSCEEAFEQAAREKWEALGALSSEKGILAILEQFLALCDSCSPNGGTAPLFGRSKESRALYTVLGKYSILDTEALRKELQFGQVKDLSPETVEWWLDKSIRLMHFLATGDFADTTDTSQYFLHAIAPAVASYNSFSNSKYGYDTATFYLTIDVDGNNVADYHKEISILSEFSYDMHTQYYCLPNVVRSNEKWWIDPFVIKCKLIDTICKR